MPILSCSAPNCDLPRKVKGYCNMHYQRMRAHGSLEKPAETFTCEHCGETKAQDKRGPKPKFCSRECGYKAYRAATRDKVNADRRAKNAAKPMHQHACTECGTAFESRHEVNKYCSTRCCNAWMDSHNPERCAEPDCDRGVRAKGMCAMHWRRRARAEGREANPEWSERRKANYQKRRAQKLNLPAESIRPADVYERDEWVCGICSFPVDRMLVYPDPSSASLDHILPLSKGGHHVLVNVQLAHLSCNVQKGAQVEVDAMSS